MIYLMPTQPSLPNNLTKTFAKRFEKAAGKISSIVGSPYWFFFSVLMVIVWFPTGFFLGWNEIWHLYINTSTTILTFLMMSLLHASQGKWERKMERDQEKEKAALKKLVTEALSEEKEVQKEDIKAPVVINETINSLK